MASKSSLHTISKLAMNRRPNPLTLVVFLVVFLIMVFESQSWLGFGWLVTSVVIAIRLAKISPASLFFRIRPFLLFLPVMFALYFVGSVILTQSSLHEIGRSMVFSGARIVLMILGTATFLETSSTAAMLDALRTAWLKLGLRWRFVEDGFQLLSLTFRFFPMLKEEVNGTVNIEKFLGLSPAGGRLEMIRRMASYLPCLIVNCLHRAENLGVAMETRRYGRILPRGVARPVGFSLIDLFYLLFLFFFFRGFLAFA